MTDKDVTTNELPVGFGSTVGDHNCFMSYRENGVLATDLAKMRDEAYRRQQGDSYNPESESTVIHLHRFTDLCDVNPDTHEIWLRKEKTDAVQGTSR